MTPFNENFFHVAAIGVGATLLMDLWLLLLKALGIPTLDFAMLGRWIGHMADRKWAHDGIARAAPVRRESALGWAAHYATGIGFALLLVAVAGVEWLHAPTLAPALLFGVGSVILPLFVMQPAMGAGLASSRTRTPMLNRFKSVANHAVFGLGLYAAAMASSSCLPRA
ncbi:MAG: hypothetical protein JWP36_1194 [Paucimonas sp.]|nr:hypothetical protein [Paucimonas sp.]